MGRGKRLPFPEWLEYIKEHVRADFDRGLLFWAKRMRGRKMYKPIGCTDSNGYVKLSIANRSTYAHSVIFFLYYGYWAELIDHDNRDRADNRPRNLLDSNYSKNALNAGLWKTNTTGIKGASLTKFGTYKVTKCGRHLGTFQSAEAARDAYNKN